MAVNAPAQSASYTVVDLGSPSGTISSARALNNAGQIVGDTGTGATGDPVHAALWTVGTNGAVVGKDIDPAINLNSSTTSSAQGINDAGLIGGYVFLANGYHAASFQVAADGKVACTVLGAFGAQDFGEAFGYGINRTGQVVGGNYVTQGPTTYHAFSFALGGNGAPVDADLGTLGGDNSTGYAINDAGWMVGDSQAVPGTVAGSHPYLAALWAPRGDGTFTALNLGSRPGGTTSSALGLNNVGQIVGLSGAGTQPSQHATLWTVSGSSVTVKDLGTLGKGLCEALAINDAGQIVGSYSAVANTNTTYRFVYTAAGGLVDVNKLVGSNPVATGITALGRSQCLNRFGSWR